MHGYSTGSVGVMMPLVGKPVISDQLFAISVFGIKSPPCTELCTRLDNTTHYDSKRRNFRDRVQQQL